MYQLGTLVFNDPLQQLKQNILHIDMDAFYASLAERDDESLKGKPVVMAKHPNDTGGTGIVTTANYIAREYGIHSGMPSIEAYRLCPEAVFVSVNHPYVRTVSQQIHNIYLNYTEDIQRVAYDEAYLSLPIGEDGVEVARQIQSEIKEVLNLTCSIGVSYNKILAKMGSDYQKPNGITVINPEDAISFLDPIKVEDFHGIGPKTTERLYDEGIYTIQDLRHTHYETIYNIFGSSTDTMLQRVSGIDPRPVVTNREPKSSGNERTYHPFLSSNNEVRKSIVQLIDKLGDTLEKEDTLGTMVVLKIRDSEFNNYSKRIGVNYLFNDKATIYELAIQCWIELRSKIMSPIRLVGVTLVGLDQREDGGDGQVVLF